MMRDKVIVYDDSCPMCRLYTYWFVAWGFLEPGNRIGFANAPDEVMDHLDLDRGRHEIPLFDRSTKQAVYGLAALMGILESKWTWLKPVFRLRLLYWMLYPVYQIITYNRRVIAGCRASCGYDCAPDLSRGYRSLYLGLTIAFTVSVTTMLASEVIAPLGGAGPVGVGLIWGFVFSVALISTVSGVGRSAKDNWDVAGNAATTCAVVALLVSPLVLGSALPVWVSVAVLCSAALLGMSELHRRQLL